MRGRVTSDAAPALRSYPCEFQFRTSARLLFCRWLNGRCFFHGRRLVVRGAFELRALLFAERLDIAHRQADLPLAGIDLDDARANAVARLIETIEFRFSFTRNFRNVRERFDAIGQSHEETEVGDLRNGADHFVADVMRLRELIPVVRQKFANRRSEEHTSE